MADEAIQQRRGNLKDLTGQRFGRLVAIEYLGARPSKTGYKRTWWRCACDCGLITEVVAPALVQGNTKSCGCYLEDSRHTHTRTHGKSHTREFAIWNTMRARCSNPNSEQWKYYGGRGIKVCAEWANDFAAFISHIGPRPSERHSIDRIDVEGHYEPGNVRWATAREQRLNQREKTLCLKGHELAGDNLKIRKSGARRYRRCLTCERQAQRARRAKQKGEQ